MSDFQAVVIFAGLVVVSFGLLGLGEAIRDAGKWIGEAIWHADYQDPPQWRKR